MKTVALQRQPREAAAVGDLCKTDGRIINEGPWANPDAEPDHDDKNPICPNTNHWQPTTGSTPTNDWKEKPLPRHKTRRGSRRVSRTRDRAERSLAAAKVVDSRRVPGGHLDLMEKPRDYIVVPELVVSVRRRPSRTPNLYRRSSDGKWVVISLGLQFQSGTHSRWTRAMPRRPSTSVRTGI